MPNLPQLPEALILVIAMIAIGLAELAVDVGLSDRLKPGAAMIAAIIVSFLLAPSVTVETWRTVLLLGIVAGLVASGLWPLASAVQMPSLPWTQKPATTVPPASVSTPQK